MHRRISEKYLRNIGYYWPIVSSFATFWKTFAIFAHLCPTYVCTHGRSYYRGARQTRPSPRLFLSRSWVHPSKNCWSGSFWSFLVTSPRLILMPRSHWAFLASPMYSRWKLTSIRRCSGGINEPSANNLNSYSWGSISPMPKIFNACFEIFHEPLAMFCLEKCSANIRRWSATNRGIFAEQSPNIRWYFLIWDAWANLCEVSAKHQRFLVLGRSGKRLLSLLIYVQRKYVHTNFQPLRSQHCLTLVRVVRLSWSSSYGRTNYTYQR